MTPLLNTTGWFVWAAETKGDAEAWYFDVLGGTRGLYSLDNSLNNRAFAVRPGVAGKIATPSGSESRDSEVEAESAGKAERYIALGNRVVLDKATRLEWWPGPDRSVSWDEAREWIETINRGGGTWRMPTVEELKTLYQEGTGTRNMTPLIHSTGWLVWSSEKKHFLSTKVWGVHFYDGDQTLYFQDSRSLTRVFAVRSDDGPPVSE